MGSLRRKSFPWCLGLTLLTGLFSSFYSHAGWEVEWIDKFNTTSVDWQKWTAQVQANYNNEIQCYTDDETSDQANLIVSDGTLKIVAHKKQVNCEGLNGESKSWTSGRLNSKDKQEFLYGRVEARIKFDTLSGGVWPAFWALENRISEHPKRGDNDTVNWPNPGAGEIDIWEWFSNEPDSYITNFFNTSGCGSEFRPQYENGGNDVLDFHIYAMEWTEQEVKFLMNNEVLRTVNISNCPQYKEPMFVLINLAIGGNLGGNVDPTLSKATLEVDYIAHCSISNTNDAQYCNESTPVALDSDGDGVSDNLDQCENTPNGETTDTTGCTYEVGSEPTIVKPSTNAPEPAALSSDVISIFSDSYQDVTGVDLNPNWGQPTVVGYVTAETADSTSETNDNSIIMYQGLTYQGIAFENNAQDVSDMDYFHLDVWTNNPTTLKTFLISPGPVEIGHSYEVKDNEWVSLDIPMAQFQGVDLTNVFQLKTEGSGTVFFDNLFFFRESTANDNDSSDGSGDDGNTDEGNSAENVAPVVSLAMIQNNQAITLVDASAGTVTVQLTVTDDNSADQHSVIWSASDLLSGQISEQTYQFDPSNLPSGNYQVSVTVRDSGVPSMEAQASVSFTIDADSESSASASGLLSIFVIAFVVAIRRRFTASKSLNIKKLD